MTYQRFVIFNVAGAALWVGLFTLLGYFFGNIPTVEENFTLVIMGIIFISVLPPIIEFFRERNDDSLVHRVPLGHEIGQLQFYGTGLTAEAHANRECGRAE